jgi:hypothetical protein
MIITKEEKEEIVFEIVNGCELEDSGLLDIGKYDHEFLAKLVSDILDKHTSTNCE